MSFIGLGPRLPLNPSKHEGIILNKTMPEVVRQNLKNLLLTNPGERIMDLTFGVGLKRFLFEQDGFEMKQNLTNKILQQTKKYLSFLNIENIDITKDEQIENVMFIKILYTIIPIKQTDTLNVEVRI